MIYIYQKFPKDPSNNPQIKKKRNYKDTHSIITRTLMLGIAFRPAFCLTSEREIYLFFLSCQLQNRCSLSLTQI